jgi:hypothetical protein
MSRDVHQLPTPLHHQAACSCPPPASCWPPWWQKIMLLSWPSSKCPPQQTATRLSTCFCGGRRTFPWRAPGVALSPWAASYRQHPLCTAQQTTQSPARPPARHSCQPLLHPPHLLLRRVLRLTPHAGPWRRRAPRPRHRQQLSYQPLQVQLRGPALPQRWRPSALCAGRRLARWCSSPAATWRCAAAAPTISWPRRSRCALCAAAECLLPRHFLLLDGLGCRG